MGGALYTLSMEAEVVPVMLKEADDRSSSLVAEPVYIEQWVMRRGGRRPQPLPQPHNPWQVIAPKGWRIPEPCRGGVVRHLVNLRRGGRRGGRRRYRCERPGWPGGKDRQHRSRDVLAERFQKAGEPDWKFRSISSRHLTSIFRPVRHLEEAKSCMFRLTPLKSPVFSIQGH